MPSNTERSRAERLADVYGRAGRIRRRQRLARGGALVGSLALVTGFVVGIAGAGDREVDVVAGPESTATTSDTAESPVTTDLTTAAPSTTSPSASHDVAPSTTTSVRSRPGVIDPPVSTTIATAPAAPVCRNSYDPVCGPFRYDPPPVNLPMAVDVVASPATPAPGEEIVFTVTVTDDGPISPNDCINTQGYGDETPSIVCTASCAPRPQPFGPWDPPPPETRTVTEEFRHAYRAPGAYSAEFTYNLGDDCNLSPYRSTASGTVTVTVG